MAKSPRLVPPNRSSAAASDSCAVLDAESLIERLRSRLDDASLPSGERVVAHCDGTNEILTTLAANHETQCLIWLALAVGLIPKDELLNLAGDERQGPVAALRSLLLMQTVPAGGGKRDLAEQELIRRMFLAMSANAQVVLVRLASRLQTLRYHAQSKSKPSAEQARFTLRVLAPLANRLGLGQLKWEMEDLAFRFSDDVSYQTIAKALDEKRRDRETFIRLLADEVRNGLRQAGLEAEVSGRPKNIYSIYNKMRLKQLPVERLLDLRALRIVVSTIDQCYAALDWVHKRFSPLLSEFNDYIARPKPNGYRSLHSVVLHDDARPVEFQIRTLAMHREAELGFASHWHYKEASIGLVASKGKAQDQDRIDYVRQLLAWKQDLSLSEGTGSGPNRAIFVLTPQGKVLELPPESTPIDFAYLLHTDLGHRCRGAKIDGAMVPLHTRLRSGQTVEVIAARASDPLGPSRDWLNPSLGYLGSPRARSKVRQWFHALDEERDLSIGRAKLEKIMQREGHSALAQEEIASRLGMDGVKSLFLAIAREDLSTRAIEQAVRHDESRPSAKADALHFDDDSDRLLTLHQPVKARKGWTSAPKASLVLVNGVSSLMSHLAKCCHPIPPDDIAGFVTRGVGVSIHRVGCSTYNRLLDRHPERAVPVSWGADASTEQTPRATRRVGAERIAQAVFVAELMVRANDRPGLLRDLTDVLSRLKLRLSAMRSHASRDQISIRLKLELSHQRELAFAIRHLRGLNGVVLITRVGD
ncbi:MAG: bifunctional (p)ppGpp synthetase/guanosine-3',5'-bis(diphosphate) 3'-pyrophosphohydrolase [Betaproteobacteria bacterium]|nr:bifunctional (p)ppGpp synthetase/guanosine-3',5'-bis(diphosphate) 3'-pyrophosphohydrolase [Betaproteobacteria bacterium]